MTTYFFGKTLGTVALLVGLGAMIGRLLEVTGGAQVLAAAQVETILNDALGPICAIILITGAGGMFGGVLRHSGIGEALSDSLADLGLPLVISAFFIATLLRVAQGSATVALTTAARLLSAGAASAAQRCSRASTTPGPGWRANSSGWT